MAVAKAAGLIGNPKSRNPRQSDTLSNSRAQPFKVAKLAVEDPDASVRYWMARNARALDYRERNSPTRKHDDTHPERNLEARLRADLVPVVRAAAFENVCLHRPGSVNIEDDLRAMSKLERLAYMRNPGRTSPRARPAVPAARSPYRSAGPGTGHWRVCFAAFLSGALFFTAFAGAAFFTAIFFPTETIGREKRREV